MMTNTQQSKSGGGQRRAHRMMRSMPLDDEMIRLKRKAQEREEKLGNQANGRLTDPPNGDEEDAGASVNEHADTWGFSWMPAIEDFVEQAAEAQQRNEDDSEESSPLGANYRSDTDDDEESSLRGPPTNITIRSSFCDPTSPSSGAARSSGGLSPSGSSLQRGGRKRRRPHAGGVATLSSSSSSSRRRAPRPPSYNETLLADKSFHNPHASETMADAFGILRPASFVLDVGADDRPWGGAAGVAAAGAKGATAEGGEADVAAGNRGGEDQNWFYDTVRDRQNRLWADTRVRKGVELARKGQHQAAIDAYTQALGMCPDHDDGLVARGAAFASTGRLRQAVQDLSRALSVNPQNGNASSYLKETRRRMERQEARETPGASATIGNTTTFENRTDSSVNGRKGLNGVSAAGGAVMPASMMASAGSAERDEASKAALGALLHDGAEGDALRKMRALLEEDEKKRKRRGARGEGRGGGDGDGEEGSRKKKSRKKDKKSSSKSKRSSSGRHRKRDRRESSGGGGSRHDSSSTSSSSGNSSAEDADARSSSSKKKKKKRHLKRKKRSSTKAITTAAVGFRNGGSRGSGTGVSMTVSAEGGEDSEGDEAHPILQRKKHSLWG